MPHGGHAAIARPVGDGWEGRWHQTDGWPEALGRWLRSAYSEHFDRDLDAMLAYLIDEHPAGWRTVVDRDPHLETGYRNYRAYDVLIDGRWDPAQIPSEAECFCHGELQMSEFMVRRDAEGYPVPDWSWLLDFVYVLSPAGMAVLVSPLPRALPHGVWERVEHELGAFIGWDETDVDWTSIHAKRYRGEPFPWFAGGLLCNAERCIFAPPR